MTEPGRDRLRELLDAVLDERHETLADMAGGAFSSPHHFNRRVRRDSGEPPVSMRRRVMLERAAWRMAGGASVTDAAFEAGYESVEGFTRAYSRAYGHPPGTPVAEHWLPAPNGIHFHPPTSLWVSAPEPAAGPLTEQLVRHDLDDTRALLELAAGVPGPDYEAVVVPGLTVLEFDGPDEQGDLVGGDPR
jgi:AraC family transcriptional regulator